MVTPPSFPPPRSNLLRKIVLLFLLTSAVAFGIIFLFKAGHPMAILYLLSLDSALLGLTAGFGARFILKSRHAALRLLAAFAALTMGLIVLGLFTRWKYGLGPLTFHQNQINWAGLLQLVIGGIVLILSMFAWRKPVAVITTVQEHPARPAVRKTSSKSNKDSRATTKAARKPRRPARVKAGSLAVIQDPPKTRRKNVRGGSTVPSPRRRSRKPEVQFATGEEHRCPYCLELVGPDDPRGVVECKVCHTLHHADCWAITGVCQVPHLNS